MDRAEHLTWAKQRALAELDAGGDNGWVSAMASIHQDFAAHPDLADHAGLGLMTELAFAGNLTNARQVREFINGLQ